MQEIYQSCYTVYFYYLICKWSIYQEQVYPTILWTALTECNAFVGKEAKDLLQL